MNRLFRSSTRRRRQPQSISGLEALEPRLVLSAASVMSQTSPAALDQVFADGAPAAAQQQNSVPQEVRALLSKSQRDALKAARQKVKDIQTDVRNKKTAVDAAKAALQTAKARLDQARSAYRTAKAVHGAAKTKANAAKTAVDNLKQEIADAKARKARFETHAANLIKSGLIEDWIAKYGENSHEVQQARSALQQQIDGAKAAHEEVKNLQTKLTTAKTEKQTADAAKKAAGKALKRAKTALANAHAAWLTARQNAQTAATALKNCQTALQNAKAAERQAVRSAYRQAGARARQIMDQHTAAVKAFQSASQTFRQRLDEIDQRRGAISNLANWFAVVSEVAGEMDANPDPTKSLELGSRLLHAAGRFLFPSLDSLTRNAQGELEAGQAKDIQLWQAIEAGNKLNKNAAQLDSAQKNLEKVHAAQPFLTGE